MNHLADRRVCFKIGRALLVVIRATMPLLGLLMVADFLCGMFPRALAALRHGLALIATLIGNKRGLF